MYKVIFVLFIVFGKVLTISASHSDSLIYIKGYYVTQFLKSEISHSFEQKIKKRRKETYSIPIDYTQISFFVPTEVDSKIVVGEEEMSNKYLSISYVSMDTLFFLPTNEAAAEYVFKLLGKKDDLSRDICILSEVRRFSPYYSFEHDSLHLYKCVYLEGWALKKRIPNIESERFKLFIDIDWVNREAKFLTLFFIRKIKSYTPLINMAGVTSWFPFLED